MQLFIMDRCQPVNPPDALSLVARRVIDGRRDSKRVRVNQCSGFTILEALIATVVLVTGLLTVLGFLSTALQLASEAQTRTVATVLAESKLHTLHSYLPVMDTAPGSSSVAECDEPTSAAAVAFSRCWWVDDSRASLPPEDPESSCVEDSYGTGAACWVSVRVEVAWTDRQANPQQVVLTSMTNILAPERNALDLMAWVTYAQQPAVSPQWLLAAEVVAESGSEHLTDPDEDMGGDGTPGATPGDNPSQPNTCSPWWELEGGLDGELPPSPEVENGC